MSSRVPRNLISGTWNKHKRLRAVVTVYLRKVDDATTQQILQHVNDTTKHGAVMNQLANILAKAPEFEKIGTDQHDGFTGCTNTVCRWGLSGITGPKKSPK